MSDKTYPSAADTSRRLRDMGDGSHAEVVAVMLVGGSSGELVEVDATANALVTQNMVHKQIHNGIAFEADYVSESVADDETIEMLISTDASQSVHIRFQAGVGGDARIQIFENPTVTDNGTAITPVNRNRTSANTAVTSVYHTPTTSADGTILADHLAPGGGTGKSTGAIATSFEEYILKSSEDYLFRVTNISGSNNPLSISVAFYEPS